MARRLVAAGLGLPERHPRRRRHPDLRRARAQRRGRRSATASTVELIVLGDPFALRDCDHRGTLGDPGLLRPARRRQRRPRRRSARRPVHLDPAAGRPDAGPARGRASRPARPAWPAWPRPPPRTSAAGGRLRRRLERPGAQRRRRPAGQVTARSAARDRPSSASPSARSSLGVALTASRVRRRRCRAAALRRCRHRCPVDRSSARRRARTPSRSASTSTTTLAIDVDRATARPAVGRRHRHDVDRDAGLGPAPLGDHARSRPASATSTVDRQPAARRTWASASPPTTSPTRPPDARDDRARTPGPRAGRGRRPRRRRRHPDHLRGRRHRLLRRRRAPTQPAPEAMQVQVRRRGPRRSRHRARAPRWTAPPPATWTRRRRADLRAAHRHRPRRGRRRAGDPDRPHQLAARPSSSGRRRRRRRHDAGDRARDGRRRRAVDRRRRARRRRRRHRRRRSPATARRRLRRRAEPDPDATAPTRGVHHREPTGWETVSIGVDLDRHREDRARRRSTPASPASRSAPTRGRDHDRPGRCRSPCELTRGVGPQVVIGADDALSLDVAATLPDGGIKAIVGYLPAELTRRPTADGRRTRTVHVDIAVPSRRRRPTTCSTCTTAS